MDMTNIYTAPPIEGRSDVATALGSSAVAMFLYDIEPGGASCPYHYEYVESGCSSSPARSRFVLPRGSIFSWPGRLHACPPGPLERIVS